MAQRDRASGRSASRPGKGGSGRPPAVRPSGATGGDLAAQRDRIRAVIQPVIEAADLDLEELAVSRVGRRHLLRVTVDGDGGVGLDAIAEVSRAISAALDADEQTGGDFTPTEYVLEVSSPGTDRPLALPRHWRRNLGRLVSVRVGERQLTGRIVAADDERVTLEVAGVEHDHGYPELGPGRVQIEFNRLDEIADEDLAEFEDAAGAQSATGVEDREEDEG